MTIQQQFIGTWRLIDQQSFREGGTSAYPRGEEALGILMYDAAGNMQVQLARQGSAGGDMSSFKTAMENFLAYFGTYTIDESAQTVTHHVVGSSYPGYVGTNQVRQFALDGDTLTLTAKGFGGDGEAETRVLRWRRA